MQLRLRELISVFGLLCGAVIVVIGIVCSGHFFAVLPTSSAENPQAVVMNNFRAVFVTTPNIEVAKKIAHGLVSNRLAACVNIIPQITSVYEWEGKINEDSELLLMIKTESDRVDQIDKFVRDNHPYDVPEVIAVPIDQGSESYLKWIKDTLKGGGPTASTSS